LLFESSNQNYFYHHATNSSSQGLRLDSLGQGKRLIFPKTQGKDKGYYEKIIENLTGDDFSKKSQHKPFHSLLTNI